MDETLGGLGFKTLKLVGFLIAPSDYQMYVCSCSSTTIQTRLDTQVHSLQHIQI